MCIVHKMPILKYAKYFSVHISLSIYAQMFVEYFKLVISLYVLTDINTHTNIMITRLGNEAQ